MSNWNRCQSHDSRHIQSRPITKRDELEFDFEMTDAEDDQELYHTQDNNLPYSSYTSIQQSNSSNPRVFPPTINTQYTQSADPIATATSSAESLSNLISSLSTEVSPISPFPGHGTSATNPADSNANLLSPIPRRVTPPNNESLKLQIPQTSPSSYWDQQLASPFEVAPFPSPLIGPSDAEDYDSMALFKAFNGRSSPMSATVSRASSLRRPMGLSPQDKKASGSSPIAPVTVAAATAALSLLKRQNVQPGYVPDMSTLESTSTYTSGSSFQSIVPITREKRTISEYVPVSNNASNSLLPPRVPGILADKTRAEILPNTARHPQHPLQTSDQLFIQKREEQSQVEPIPLPPPPPPPPAPQTPSTSRTRSNSELKNPPPYRPPYGRSSSSEHVDLIEKLHRERIPNFGGVNTTSGRSSPLSKPSSTTTNGTSVSSNHEAAVTSSTITTTATSAKPSATITSLSLSHPDVKPVGRIYEAYDTKKRRSTWREVSLLGRGAFSRVVLAKPVERFVTAAYRGRSDSILVAIKIVELGAAGGASRDRIESGLSREIDILKVSITPDFFVLVLTTA